MLAYLDQNHASRVAKFLLGQPRHDHFGRLHAALAVRRPCIPPSPFHVLETRGGYLLPTLQDLFGRFSGGLWVRPFDQVVRAQARRGALDRADLLTRNGDWWTPATLDPLRDLLEAPLTGGFFDRCTQVRAHAAHAFGLGADDVRALPFFRLLGRMVAFRSLDRERLARPSDLTDLVMAATVAPYVDALATDRYVRELLVRVGYRGRVYSGRRPDVERFADDLLAGAPVDGRPVGDG